MSVEEMRLPGAGEERKEHRFSYRGFHRYIITLPVYKSHRVFAQQEHVLRVLDMLAECARQFEFEVVAYCFLPDRLAMVARGKSTHADMREFLRSFRERSSSLLLQQLGHPLWKKKYTERVLRKSEITKDVARDLFELPVRNGLAARSSAYPFQGSFVLRFK